MTLTTMAIGAQDGRTLYHYFQTDEAGTPVGKLDEAARAALKSVLITGPSRGSVTLADGTTYDVAPDVIEVDPAHVGELMCLIGQQHEANGHPSHAPTENDPYPEPFVHLCTPMCGPAKRPDSHPMQAMALARATRMAQAVADPVHAHEVAQALGLVDPEVPPPAAMARASTAAENAALNGLDGTGTTNVIPDVALHVGDTGTTGTSENANAGGYSRLACSWNAAASGAKTNSSSLAFSTAGTVAVTYGGGWSSATYGAGTFGIGFALGSAVTAASITVAPGAISIGAV